MLPSRAHIEPLQCSFEPAANPFPRDAAAGSMEKHRDAAFIFGGVYSAAPGERCWPSYHGRAVVQ